MLKAGFAEVDITPPLDWPMGRLSGPVGVCGIRWPLFVRAAYLCDGSSESLLFSLDKNRLLGPGVDAVKSAVEAATGIAASHIFTACTHTHNVPFATRWHAGDTYGPLYLERLKEAFAAAAVAARGTARAVTLHAGRQRVAGLASNRRRVYSTGSKEVVATHGPTDVPNFIRFEGPADDELQVVTAIDAGGRVCGGFINFACHPTTMYSEQVWSADYIGPLTDALRNQGGGVFLFFNGAAGNISPEKPPGLDGPALATHMGETLATAVLSAEMEPLAPAKIAVSAVTTTINQRTPSADQVACAQRFLATSSEEQHQLDLLALNQELYGYPYVMYQPSVAFCRWLCGEIIGMWEWQRRAALPTPCEAVTIQVLAIGSWAVVGFPGELFAEFGLSLKAESPFSHTMVVEHANGWHGYIPTREAFERGGYETTFAYQSKLIPEAGEYLCQAALKTLQALR